MEQEPGFGAKGMPILKVGPEYANNSGPTTKLLGGGGLVWRPRVSLWDGFVDKSHENK